MFGVVVTKATMSTSCDILAFAGEAGEMGWWGWGWGGGEYSPLSVLPLFLYELESCDKPWLFQFI